MITLTDKAVKALDRFIRGSAEPVAGLRVAVSGGGCSGLQYQLALKGTPETDDLVIRQQGVQLFIDPISATLLEGVTVDFIDSLTGSGFKFVNPNATATCNCGSSFSA